MEISLYLTQVMGLFFLIGGLAVLINRNTYQKAEMSLLKNQPVTLLFALLIFVLGLLIITKHNIWEFSHIGIVTFVGWVLALKGGLIVLFPDILDVFKKKTISKSWYWIGGILWFVVGAFMTYNGFFA